MPVLIQRMNQGLTRRFQPMAALAAALGCAFMPSCNSSSETAATSSVAPEPAAVTADADHSKLALARWEAAREKHRQGLHDEALALLASALVSDPASPESFDLVRQILATTRWHLPEVIIDHGFPIDRLELSATDDLWVSLSGHFSTTVRWDLKNLSLESVLFPVSGSGTQTLVADPSQRFMIIERAGIVLLCDALTLKPIRDLGPIPKELTPSAVIAFSDDGLLVAHPETDATNASGTWQMRDAATGEILRSWEPSPDQGVLLASHLDRTRLRLLAANGTLVDIPISPIEEPVITPEDPPVSLLHAQFLDGENAVLLIDEGPHHDPSLSIASFGSPGETDEEASSLLRQRHSWNRHPSIWSGMFRDDSGAPVVVKENRLTLSGLSHAPLTTAGVITAAAFHNDRVVIGNENGRVEVRRLLPLPLQSESGAPARLPNADFASSLMSLSQALGGLRHDDASATFQPLEGNERQVAFQACEFATVGAVFPELDFSAIREAFESLNPREAPSESLAPLHRRLGEAGLGETPTPVPRAFTRTIEEVFQSGDHDAILSAIASAGGKGRDATTALALALGSDEPTWIRACLESAKNLPPLLDRLANSRANWLDGRKAEALATWNKEFPELAEVRRREDWDGWEQADFAPAFHWLQTTVRQEFGSLALPPSADADQRKALVKRLTHRNTLAIVGRQPLATASLEAALALSSIHGEGENSLRLANHARHLGAPPAACLRAEAMAWTALGDFRKAQPCWITLITEHPVETHQPGDYAEAAYTSYENDDPRQAMEILSTGMHRFANDSGFALRAGWVALLIGKAERGYEFLVAGDQLGYAGEKLENALALLAIAAAESGYIEDAQMYFEALVEHDPAWADPETLETLEWPEALKATLRQLTW